MRKRSKMTIGILHSAGTDKSRVQNGNFDHPSEDNFLQGVIFLLRQCIVPLGYCQVIPSPLKNKK
jgi:hypothetical protein